MKIQKKGLVIYSNENSAKIKIEDSKERIIEVNNNVNAKIGQNVSVEFNVYKLFKLIYIKYIQPILFILLGFFIGDFISFLLNKSSIVYNSIFICILFTISLIYKDYYKEKNKYNKNDKPDIIKII
ncbi:sigma E positive regulator RseC/MucC [[Clostridium] sordellii]|uniref:SoxR reducing system RseC family protein n=1 Tax=Paraclostridium sordellii TaxID=1505 RepID=UPI0005E83B7F|nr:SoxR reducing system RseC family protein [Paeniclostridium sordellii]MDU1453308.1 SoxR reducing system RseC family protein [Paeniclostridium sordellii]CEO06268.1 sigma E positive regulator RseC/MucC [[Clostridium] sordellii] [Paeniclostridium sordellii]